MFLKNDTINDDENLEILSGLDIACPVPAPSSAGSQAARWMQKPHLMLVYLTDVLNQLLERCETCSSIDVDLQYRLKRDDPPQRDAWFMFMDMWLQGETSAIDLVNRSGNVPFALATVEALYVSLKASRKSGDWSEFTTCVMTYRRELQRLADWIQFRHELDSPSPLVPVSDGTKSTTPTDVENFTKSLGLNLCESKRTVHRDGPKYSDLQPVPLSGALWQLLLQLLMGTTTGVTRKHLANTLLTSEPAVSTRKSALKRELFALDLTIPGDEFRIASVC